MENDKIIADALVRCVSLLNELHVLGRDISLVLSIRDCLQAIANAHAEVKEEIDVPSSDTQ